MKKVITISREFGSGGRELGYRLAEALGIPFYDKEIISMAADNSNLADEVFEHHDEMMIQHEFNQYTSTPLTWNYEVPLSDQVFFAQSEVIKKLAAMGPCVIVGRCADMILEDSVNLFVCAKADAKLSRMMSIEPETPVNDMKRRIREVNRKRKEYYQYYTGNIFGNAQNYNLCMDSSHIGVSGCLETVLTYLNAMERVSES